MSQTTITVADAKAKRRELERSIQALLEKFQTETGLEPNDVRVERVSYTGLDSPPRTFVASVSVRCVL